MNYIKNNLSFSTDGTTIGLITTPKLIHLSTASSTDWDEVWVYVNNIHTYQVTVTIEFGGSSTPIVITIPSRSGLTLVVPGLILNGGYVVTAYASVADRVFVTGYVNSIVGGSWSANGNAVYGYVVGGESTGATNPTTGDRIVFSTGVTSINSVSNLSTGISHLSAVSDTTLYGYFVNSAMADRIIFSTGIVSVNAVSVLSQSRNAPSSLGDSENYGYFFGGVTSGGGLVATADRIVFSTGVTSANTISNLSQARQYTAAISDGIDYGYVGGGHTGANVATTDRIVFSTGITLVNTVSNLSVARLVPAGLSDNTMYGYFAGGESAAASVITDRIVFSTGVTSANTISNLSQARYGVRGLGDGFTYGYFCGGYSDDYTATSDRIVFSTGITLVNTVSNLSVVRYTPGCLSDFCV